jgi:acyl carrier protein
MEIEGKVRDFILEHFLWGDKSKKFSADDSFLEKRIVDSTGVLELVNFIEESFKIKVEDEELIPDNLDSLKKITEFIQRKLKVKI